MSSNLFLKNIVDNKEVYVGNEWLSKISPVNQELICKFANSSKEDVNAAILSAQASYNKWSQLSSLARGVFLRKVAELLEKNIVEMSQAVSLETGKSSIFISIV